MTAFSATDGIQKPSTDANTISVHGPHSPGRCSKPLKSAIWTVSARIRLPVEAAYLGVLHTAALGAPAALLVCADADQLPALPRS